MYNYSPLTGWIACLTIISAAANAQTNAEKLRAHSNEFEKEIIRVTDGLYVAVGYALANSIMIEGDDGVVVVDTTESPAAAKEILGEFRKITDKPVAAIVYTHFHADHILGARVFSEGNDNVEVIAHELTAGLAQHSYGMLGPAIRARSVRQVGALLPPNDRVNSGIGPLFRLDGAASMANYRPPTTTVGAEPLDLAIAGVRMKFVHAPGETDDQLYVWLPDKKALMPGDNFYRAFPNLYAIRGTQYRDVRKWADSLDKMLQEPAEFLVPSHTRPISGRSEIQTRLTNYRDAIRFVHDETVKGINEGLTPDELVERVVLPERLQNDPWLAEYYGTVAWSVRNIFNGYLGWFDGNPTHLNRLSEDHRAKRIAELAGGTEKMLDAARNAFENGDRRWTLELTDWIRRIDPENNENAVLRRQALRALANDQVNANARNYYLMSAQQGL